MISIKVGDRVLVAELNRQTYRPDLIEVVVLDVQVSTKRTTYHLSDGSSVHSVAKLYKLPSETSND